MNWTSATWCSPRGGRPLFLINKDSKERIYSSIKLFFILLKLNQCIPDSWLVTYFSIFFQVVILLWLWSRLSLWHVTSELNEPITSRAGQPSNQSSPFDQSSQSAASQDGLQPVRGLPVPLQCLPALLSTVQPFQPQGRTLIV